MSVAERANILAHPGRDQGECPVGLHHDQMVLAGEALAVLDLHHLPGPRMKRIEDQNLERRTPGIVTLSRPASARAGSPARSATRHAATTVPSSIIALPRLFEALALARGDGRYARLLRRRWSGSTCSSSTTGAWPRSTPTQRRDLLEIVDDRHGRGSTIITSQVPVEHWHEVIGEPTIADAILDRLVHNAHRLDTQRRQHAKDHRPTRQS